MANQNFLKKRQQLRKKLFGDAQEETPNVDVSTPTVGNEAFQNRRQRLLEGIRARETQQTAPPTVKAPVQKQTPQKPIQQKVTQQSKPVEQAPGLFENIKNAVFKKASEVAPQILTGEFAQKVNMKIADFIVDVARSAPRSGVSAYLTKTGQKEITPGAGKGFIPMAEKLLLGDKPIKDFETTGRETITSFGGDEDAAGKYGFAAGAVLAGIDLVPAAPGKKQVVEKLAKEGGIEAVKKILQKEVFKQAPDDFLQGMAERFSKINDPKKIKEELNLVQKGNKSLVENKDVITQFQKNIQDYRSFGGFTIGKHTEDASVRDITKVVDNPGIKTQTQLDLQGAISAGEVNVDKDGFITLYRGGEPSPKNELTSYSYNKEVAQGFVDEGKRQGQDIPLIEKKVKPEDIKVFIGRAEAEVMLSNKAIRKTLPEKQEDLLKAGDEKLQTNKANAEFSKQERDLFTPSQINAINAVKRAARTKAFKGGGFETLRKAKPDLVESVVQTVREVKDNSLSDEEALRYALDLPTKKQTQVSLPAEIVAANKLNKEVAAFRQGVTNGTIKTKEEVRATQETLFKIIKDSKLSLSDQAKLYSSIRKTQTAEQFAKSVDKLDERITKLSEDAKSRQLRDTARQTEKAAETKRVGELEKLKQRIIDRSTYLAEGIKSGKKFTRQEIADNQKELIDILAELPKEKRGKFTFLKGIRRATTAEKLQKEIDHVYAEVQKMVEAPAVARAKRVRKLEAKKEELGLNKEKSGEAIVEEIKTDFSTGSKVRDDALSKRKGSIEQRARTQLVDRLTPVFDFVNMAAKKLPAELNPYRKMRLLAGVSGKVEAYLEEKIAPVLKAEKNRQDDLGVLMVLERERELVGVKGLVRKRNAEQVEKGIEALKAKYGEEGFKTLQESSDKLRKVGAELLEIMNKEGIISDEAYDGIKKNNEFYTPMEAIEHIADNVEKGRFGTGASYNVAKQDAVKEIGDSLGGVGDPIEALVRKIPKIIALTEKNAAMKSLVKLKDDYPKVYEGLIVPITGDNVPKGMGVINVFENGKNVRYAVPEVIESAVKNLDAETSNILVSLGAIQAKILRAGTTGLSIPFIFTNIARDVQDALTTEFSERGMKAMLQFLATYPEAIYTAAKKGDLYKEWLKSGGAMSTLTEQVFKKTPKTIDELSGRKNLVKTTLRTPVSLIEFAGRVGEQSTRIARYKSGIRRGESIEEAGFKSRDISLDFAKAGDKVKVLNQIIPFLNAGIQGTEKLARLYKDNPVQAAAATGLLFGVPTVALYQYNSQFKDFDDIPLSERQNNWIILSRDRTPEEVEAGEKVQGVKIPKGFLGRMVANTLDSSMDFMRKKDPESFGNAALQTASGLSPVGLPYNKETLGQTLSTVLPPWMQAGIEGVSNTNLYFGTPIVPRSLQDVAPAEQYKKNTPEIYKLLGKVTGMSPLLLENTVNSTTGSVGRQIAEIASGFTSGFNPEKITAGIKKGTIDQIGRRFSGVQSGEQSNKDVDKLFEKLSEGKTENLKLKREVETLHADLKNKSPEEINKKLISLAEGDPDKLDKLIEIMEEEALGLTYKERLVKQLGVENGARAEFIAEEIKRIKNPEERGEYVVNLFEKKILSDEVVDQLLLLAAKENLSK